VQSVKYSVEAEEAKAVLLHATRRLDVEEVKLLLILDLGTGWG
jgi:hypothetical protein